MRYFVSFLILSVFVRIAPLQAQTAAITQTTRDMINHTGLTIPNSGTLYGLDGESGKLIGTAYFDTSWHTGTVRFYGKLNLTTDSLTNVPIRLDLYNHDVEVLAGGTDVRAAKAPSVNYVVLTNPSGPPSRFINVHEYRGDADGLAGFFEQVSVVKLTLLNYPSIHLKRAHQKIGLVCCAGRKRDEVFTR